MAWYSMVGNEAAIEEVRATEVGIAQVVLSVDAPGFDPNINPERLWIASCPERP